MAVTHEPGFWLAAFGLFVVLPFSLWWSYRLHKFWAEKPADNCIVIVSGKEYRVGDLQTLEDVSVVIRDGETKVFINGKEIKPEE